ncbi:MAG: hypothetical protein ACK2UW_08205 [Anaerolineales bacterium]
MKFSLNLTILFIFFFLLIPGYFLSGDTQVDIHYSVSDQQQVSLPASASTTISLPTYLLRSARMELLQNSPFVTTITDLLCVAAIVIVGYLLYRGFGYLLQRTTQRAAEQIVVVGDEELANYHAGDAFKREKANSRVMVVWFIAAILVGAAGCAWIMWSEWGWISLIVGAIFGAIMAERYLHFRNARLPGRNEYRKF